MPTYLLQLLGRVFGVGGGMVSSAFGILTNTMQKGFQSAIQFHKEGIAFARDMGMSAKQAQAYTDVMIARTQVLANRYGVSAEAIMQVQRGLSEATGKQLLLNDAQAEGFVQIDKLMGAQARSRFTEEIMNGMGGQINTVQGAMAKVYATAAKQGLNAKKLSDKVAQNLSMANRLSFRNGIDGITRMAALSEKLGINMQSVESAASSFLELDKAIENSAKMQMLGGSAAAMFGNPLTASYEANYDPEAFAKRMSDSLASYATFDAQKGISNINGMNMDFVRAIGQAMGISAEDAAKMAKKQAEVRFKERAFSPLLNRYGLTEDQKSFLINNGQVRNGELFYTDAKGEEHNVSRGDINQTLLDEIRKFEGMSDKDIMIKQSQTLISIDGKIEGAASTVAASFAKGIDEHLPNIGQQIEKIGGYLSSYAQQWGEDTGKAVGKAMAWINDHGSEIKFVADGLLKALTGLVSLVTTHIIPTLAAIAAWKLFGIGGLIKNFLKGKFGGGSSGGKGAVPRTSSNTSTKYKDRSWKQAKSDARLGMGSKKGGIFAKGRSGLGTLWNNSKYFRRAVKGAAGIGTALAVADVGYSIYDAEKKKNEISNNALLSQKQRIEEKNKVIKEEGQNVGDAIGSLGGGLGGAALGAAIGTAIAPGIGTILGGLLGSVAGGFGGSAVGKSIGGAVSKSFMESEHHAQGGIVGGKGGADSTPAMLTPGEIVLSETMQKNLVSLLKNPPIEVKINNEGINARQAYLPQQFEPIKRFAQGGVVGGKGGVDSTPMMLTPGEIVLSETMQKNLVSILKNPPIEVKPVGEKEYIYTPTNVNTSNVGGNTVTVKDFNVNLSGTIKLDGGNSMKNVDVKSLLNDYQFVNSLKQIIKESINADMNGGRFMNDVSTLRGHTTSSSVLGR